MSTIPLEFSEALRIFFELTYRRAGGTQKTLAQEIGVSFGTITNWMQGPITPRYREEVEKLNRAFYLTGLEAQLLLFLANPDWAEHTPHEILKAYTMLRYREVNIAVPTDLKNNTPSIPEIEATWHTAFKDTFEQNHQYWGLGTKDDGNGLLKREMKEGCYVLSFLNRCHLPVYMGGDSHYFAPPTYYVSVTARLLSGDHEADGFVLMFDEISDGSHGIFRVRPKAQSAAVVSTRSWSETWKLHAEKRPVPITDLYQRHKLAILAVDEQHWFFLDDHLIGRAVIERYPEGRLDIGIVAGPRPEDPDAPDHKTVCQFEQFHVRVPPPPKAD